MSNRPTISLLHPTARVLPSDGFPRGWRDAHDAWLERADHPENIEYVLAVHESRWGDFWNGEIPSVQDIATVMNPGRDCVVDQLNAAALASTGQLLVGVQDDLYPPEHWDTLLLLALPPQKKYDVEVSALPPDLDGECIIVCSSGAPPERDRELMIAGACTRTRYERYGFLLDPDFESMYADNWYAHVARRDEAAGLVEIIERLDIQFEHRHPALVNPNRHGNMRLKDLDATYQLQNRPQAYQDGQITFKRKLGAKLIAIGLPGQQFSGDYLYSWTVLYGHLMANRGFFTMPVMHYTSNVHCTRMEFFKTVIEARHKPDWVLTLDDDNLLSPEQFDMLLADLEENSELAGVVAWCWCDPADAKGEKNAPMVASCGRQSGWNANRTENGQGLRAHMFTLEEFEDNFRKKERGQYLVTSDDVAPDAFWSGFPVVLMRYSTVEAMGPESFCPIVRPDVKFGFTSEDTSFFYRAHQKGLKFAVDMRVKVPHLKLRAIEQQFLLGVSRQQVLEAQGKTLGEREKLPV